MSDGRFRKGQSGNPAGRPKGSGVAGRLRRAIEAEMPDVLAALIESAKAGDVQAARALLDRVVPALKPQAGAVAIPGMATGNLVERATAAIAAAASSELAPDVAAALVQAVGTLARVTEVQALQQRLEALERTLEARK